MNVNILGLDQVVGLRDISNRFRHLLTRSQKPAVPYHGMTMFPDWRLQVDISETDTEYKICGDIPGVKQDDVKILFQDGMLIIEGERKMVESEGDRRFNRTECSHGKFVRSFRMPDDADKNKVKVEFRDGTIIVTLIKTGKHIADS